MMGHFIVITIAAIAAAAEILTNVTQAQLKIDAIVGDELNTVYYWSRFRCQNRTIHLLGVNEVDNNEGETVFVQRMVEDNGADEKFVKFLAIKAEELDGFTYTVESLDDILQPITRIPPAFNMPAVIPLYGSDYNQYCSPCPYDWNVEFDHSQIVG